MIDTVDESDHIDFKVSRNKNLAAYIQEIKPMKKKMIICLPDEQDRT